MAEGTPSALALPDGPVLLDGGMGQELEHRSAHPGSTLWSAQALLDEPDLVRAVHLDFIRAGARVITTNSYTTTRTRLEPAGLGDRFRELNRLAGELAAEARDESGEPVLIAGSLPPLRGSYRVDLIPRLEEAVPLYREQAEVLAPFVDLFLCETMASAAEARAAARGALPSGKPVWVAWTLMDDGPPRLRSGETIGEAAEALQDLEVDAFLANCCSPEAVSRAMPELVALGRPAGGYANGFAGIPDKWTIAEGVDALGRRADLDPDGYLAHVRAWLAAGARIVGGCCEIGPAHIARLRDAPIAHR